MADEKKTEAPEEKKPKLEEEVPVVTQHTAGKFKYTVTTGRLPIKNEDDGEIEAQMFYHAYVADPEDKSRPVMFTFNGGPGSPSLWLHLGALGPKRVELPSDATLPKPPYRLIDNPHHWLEFADLVFIDPIGTGFSRAKDKETAKKFWGVKGDIESVSEFIRLWLSRNKRWTSPLYLAGESYGTTRASGIAGYLIDKGVAFNGIVLVSSILNFQTARFVKGNDLPYVLFLPTYTATAFYHGQLKGEFGKDLRATLDRVEEFAIGEYAAALALGDRLPAAKKASVARKLASFTGLSATYLERRDLRIEIMAFCKELLRDQGRTVGRLDSRFKGIDDTIKGNAEFPDHDPSLYGPMPPYKSTYLQYVHQDLGYETDLPYYIFEGIKEPWDWGSAGQGMPDVSESLRKALAKNEHMKVFIASGYFDLATPYFATEYTLSHMGTDAALRGQFRTAEYESGHMMYIHEPSLEQLKADVAGFVQESR